MKKVLAVAAHPDDEILGAGATLARHTAVGDEVHILFLADGVGSRGAMKGLDERRTAAINAAKALGIDKDQVYFYSFADNKMDSLPLLDIVQPLEKKFGKIKPQIIYTHHQGDLNIDHRITHQAVLTACRPQPDSTVEAIYGFEVLSSTGWAAPDVANTFAPVRYVDITDFMQKKLDALRHYDMEMRPFPHARSYESVTALATMRGTHIGVVHAEAFTVIREIIR